MLSVCLVSFNSTIPRAQSLITSQPIAASNLPLRTIKFCSVVFGVTLTLLAINSSSSVSREQQTTPLVINFPRCGAAMCITLGGRTVYLTTRREARYWSRIAIFAYPTCSRRPRQKFPVTTLGTTRMAWLSDRKIILTFVSTEYTNVTDRRTDRRTPHDGIGCAYAQHRAAKKCYIVVPNVPLQLHRNKQKIHKEVICIDFTPVDNLTRNFAIANRSRV